MNPEEQNGAVPDDAAEQDLAPADGPVATPDAPEPQTGEAAAAEEPLQGEAEGETSADSEDDASGDADEALSAEEEIAEEHRAARASAVPKPPALPARWDQGGDPALASLKGGPTEAELQRHRKSHVAPALIAIDRIDEDTTFQVRELGDLSNLATDIARLGQLFPVDVRLRPPDRFQIVCGFRRVAALRFLQRDKVLARLHTDLSDDDALLMALASAIHGAPVDAEELAAARERLESEGRLTPAARDMLEKALAEDDSLAPETVDEEGEEEVDADELADDVTLRLGEINQDLLLLAEVFAQLADDKKAELLKQLSYSAELVAYLEGK